ncbi:GIY-YIG nuclease family protein [Patescibacteria group bacterium]|nr:GIY-YIG nuclease family protein [Patescibacteria group bacterium]
MFYYLYVLRSLKDKKLYIGRTTDLVRRFKEHQSGRNLSTKGRAPFKLIYYESYSSKTKCAQQELFYKTGAGREVLRHKL